MVTVLPVPASAGNAARPAPRLWSARQFAAAARLSPAVSAAATWFLTDRTPPPAGRRCPTVGDYIDFDRDADLAELGRPAAGVFGLLCAARTLLWCPPARAFQDDLAAALRAGPGTQAFRDATQRLYDAATRAGGESTRDKPQPAGRVIASAVRSVWHAAVAAGATGSSWWFEMWTPAQLYARSACLAASNATWSRMHFYVTCSGCRRPRKKPALWVREHFRQVELLRRLAAAHTPATDPDALFVAGAMAAAAARIAAFLALWEDLPGDEDSTGCPEWAGDELGALRWTFEAAAARLAGPDELRAEAARLADQLPPFDPAAVISHPAIAVMDLIAACFACRDLAAELAGEDGAGTPWAADLAPVAWVVSSAAGCLANSFRDCDVDAARDRLGDWPAVGGEARP